MKRREVLSCALTGVAAAIMAPGAASAAQACFEVDNWTVHCSAGQPHTPVIEEQPCQSLSWATCMAYVMSGFGAEVTTRSVLDRHKMSAQCRPSNDLARIMGSMGQWYDDYGRKFLVEATRLPDIGLGYCHANQVEPIFERLGYQPLLIGTRGKTFVLTELKFAENPMIDFRVDELKVRDPWTGTPNRRILGPTDCAEPLFTVGLKIRAV